MRHVLGADIGHSGPKTVWASSENPSTHHADLFPSIVARAQPLADEHSQALAAADTITLRGTAYWVGRTALAHTEVTSLTGLTRDWVFTEQHDVLLLASIKRAIAAGFCPHGSLVIVGLPSAYFADQRKEFGKRVQDLMSAAKYERVRVKVQRQPAGVITTLMLRPDGSVADQSIDDQTYAVMDVGEYTTDVLVMSEGKVIERLCHSFPGVRNIKDRLAKLLAAKKLPHSINALNDAVQRGVVRSFGEEIDVSTLVADAAKPFEDDVLNEATRLFDRAEEYSAILLGGGGARFAYPPLARRYPATNFVRMVPDNRMAIAEGFCRLGLYLTTQEQLAA